MLRQLTCVLLLAGLTACDEGSPTGSDPTGTVAGTVFVDVNSSGSRDAGDIALGGVQMSLIDVMNDTVARMQTVANGSFVFNAVPVGTYSVGITLGGLADSLIVKSAPATLTVTRGDTAITHIQVGRLPQEDPDGTVLCVNGNAGPYACRDVNLLAHMTLAQLGGPGANANDIWGWTDPQSGKEYAIVGRTDGTAFVDISAPTAPVLVGFLPYTPGSRSTTWRDMKVYQDHVFVVADAAGQHGMQVLDLQRLRDFSGTPLQLTADAVYTQFGSAHNLVINEATGFAYAVGGSSGGQTCGGGLHMIDIRQPKSPQFAGCFADPQTGRRGTGYTHDAQCVIYSGPDGRYTGREICFGSNESALSIADVTVKTAPVAISRANYPSVAYSHQAWLSEDQQYLYMNDELDELSRGFSRTRTLVWDVAELDDPQLVAEYTGVENSTDHNLYIRGNLMYQANYTSGLRILDISERKAPTEVAFFDTTPNSANMPGFEGAWSVYPYFESGVIVVSSIGEGLFILRKR